MVDKTVEENIETAIEMTVMIEAETGPEKGHFPEIMAIIDLDIKAIVGQGQDPELAQIGIEFIVFKCREYEHFMRDCPPSREKEEIEQLLQMLNLGDEQTVTPSMSNMQDDFSSVMYGNVL